MSTQSRMADSSARARRCTMHRAQDPVKPGVPKRAAGIETVSQREKVAGPWVCGRVQEQLAPVRPRRGRRKRGFDRDESALDGGLGPAPREVEPDRVLLELWAQPQRVRRDRADLGDQQDVADIVTDREQRADRVDGVWPCDEVLGLDLLPRAR